MDILVFKSVNGKINEWIFSGRIDYSPTIGQSTEVFILEHSSYFEFSQELGNSKIFMLIPRNLIFEKIEDSLLEITHEVKNVLTIIVSSSMMINKIYKKNLLDSKKEVFISGLRDIDSSVQSVLSILKRLSNPSEMFQKEYNKSIGELMRFTKDNLFGWGEKSGIETEFKSDISSEVMKKIVRTKGISVNQVFINLVKNASFELVEKKIKKPKISVTLEIDSDNLIVKVEDNGQGIPEEYQDKIFDHKFSTKGEKGSGVGLSLSRKLLRQTGGDLIYINEKNRGAIFEFRVPVIDN